MENVLEEAVNRLDLSAQQPREPMETEEVSDWQKLMQQILQTCDGALLEQFRNISQSKREYILLAVQQSIDTAVNRIRETIDEGNQCKELLQALGLSINELTDLLPQMVDHSLQIQQVAESLGCEAGEIVNLVEIKNAEIAALKLKLKEFQTAEQLREVMQPQQAEVGETPPVAAQSVSGFYRIAQEDRWTSVAPPENLADKITDILNQIIPLAPTRTIEIKYPQSVWSNKVRRDILINHLEGTAKAHVENMPAELRNGTFEDIVAELRKARETPGERLKARSEWKHLCIRDHETVFDFCCRMKRIATRMQPDQTMDFELGSKLYECLSDWPDSYHLLAALDAPEGRVFDQVKKVALRLERTREASKLQRSKEWKRQDSRTTSWQQRDPQQRNNCTTSKAQENAPKLHVRAMNVVKEGISPVNALKDWAKTAQVYDASGNPMTFLMRIAANIRVHGAGKAKIQLHIQESNSQVILLGTNALAPLGIELKLNPEGSLKLNDMDRNASRNQVCDQHTQHGDNATAMQRVLIPPFGTAELELSSDQLEGDRVFWTHENRIASGVCRISKGSTKISVINNGNEPWLVRKGQVMGTWTNDRWYDPKTTDIPGDMLEMRRTKPTPYKQKAKQVLKILLNNKKSREFPLQLKELITKYADTFAVSDVELTQTHLIEHDIDVHSPIRQKTRPVPYALRMEVKDMLQDLEERHIIEESTSPWASPIVLVAKKDGGIRLCVDYREVNKLTKKECYPLPAIDVTLQNLRGKRYFTSLDLASGYWQVPLTKQAKEISAFTTTAGHYQFRVIPFGLTNAPAAFQRLMEWQVLASSSHKASKRD
ncbi:hypothetical protein NECAME_17359 [Necator americanus]|uniref:Reverse transcriptase domain-containing protein n=1 Tax=Necator americanus TaxID=51031 RepID=W2TRH2_NECAM|nr:hypothetical protein NECAME_17359 [Necator americanus]ETN83731.1 hypothetical protein NECAME_17359 [Necator americanus]